MTRFKKVLSASAVAMAAAAVPAWQAEAAPGLAITGGTPGAVTWWDDNDVLSQTFGMRDLDGIFGGQLALTDIPADSTVNVLVELLGYEASFNNSFVFEEQVVFESPGPDRQAESADDPLETFELTGLEGGLIDFGFGIDRADGTTQVANGENPDLEAGESGPNYFMSIEGDPTARTGLSAIVFLDDGGGGGNSDDDFDDLVVRLSVNAVIPSNEEAVGQQAIPEPATLALIGIGLIGAGVALQRYGREHGRR